jgi:CheY-like chemotaxis protein
VIFLDLKMPHMPGVEVLRSLRSAPATAEVPVIIVTSELPGDDERAEIESAAQGLVEKRELTLETLQRVLSRTCGLGYDDLEGRTPASKEVKVQAGQS